MFTMLIHITGESIAVCVFKDLNELGLDMSNILGQGYDGESSMSIAHVELQILILKSIFWLFICTLGHSLNLGISSSFSLPAVRKVIDKVKAVCVFSVLSSNIVE